MIEVEVRGRLTDSEYDRVRKHLKENGELVEVQDREMILLRGYPGYSKDPTARDTDIRLRTTNGTSEIMVKHKTSEHNVARKEVSLSLNSDDLTIPKEVLKALGFSEGIWMHRKKEVYALEGIEWSIVDVPEGLRYFEAEMEAEDEGAVQDIQEKLVNAARELGLEVLNPEEMRAFISELDAKVNKDISW